MLAVPTLVSTAGVNVALRMRPEPLRALSAPPLTVTSPLVPFQENDAPGSSLKVKVISAVSPAFKVDTSLVMARVGAVVSMVRTKAGEYPLTLPAASVAWTLSVCSASANILEIKVHDPSAAAFVVDSTVLPSVSYSVTKA